MAIGTAIFVIFCICLFIWAMNTEAGRAIIGGFVVLCIFAGAWAYQRNETVNAAYAACPQESFVIPSPINPTWKQLSTPLDPYDYAARAKCVKDHGG
jgi:phosphotransferase system  glucose/maltose/N-acetylglucosamine-specific IIC component